MHIFTLGASRATGYYVAIRLLERGDTVSIFLRSPTVLENDTLMKKYLQSGQLHLFKGDAMQKEEVLAAWTAANQVGTVDAVLFAVGPTAKFTFKGMVANPPNVSTMSYFNTLLAITSTSSTNPPPKLVVISAKAVTPESMASVPAPIRLVAGWMLRHVNLDKRGMEALVFHGFGKEYERGMTPTPDQGILPDGWKEQLPAAGWAKHAVLLRPPQLTDGVETGKYRADVKDFLVWKISRKDLARFIADRLLAVGTEGEWKKFEGEVVTIGY